MLHSRITTLLLRHYDYDYVNVVAVLGTIDADTVFVVLSVRGCWTVERFSVEDYDHERYAVTRKDGEVYRTRRIATSHALRHADAVTVEV